MKKEIKELPVYEMQFDPNSDYIFSFELIEENGEYVLIRTESKELIKQRQQTIKNILE